MEKVLQCVRLPQNGKGTIGFNLKGEYLKKYGFQLGDKVKVEHNLLMIVSYFGNFAVYLLAYKYYIIWQIAWKI